MLVPILVSCEDGLFGGLQLPQVPETTTPETTAPETTRPNDDDDGKTTPVTPPTTPPETPPETPPATDPNRIPAEVKDFGGYEYKFVMDQQTDYELQVPEEIGSSGINRALVERNRKVESLYNVLIVEERNPNGNTDGYTFLDTISVSGDYYCDIYSNYAIKMIQSHSIAGFYLDLGKLESLRLDQAWWDQDFMNEFTVNGHVYTMTGDIQTNDDLHEIFLSVNLSLYNHAYPTKDLRKIVVDDKAWTFDEFYNTWYNFKTKDNGVIGRVDTDDVVGYFYDCRTASYMYMASGLKAFVMVNNKPALTINSDAAWLIMNNLVKITNAHANLKTARIDNSNVTPGSYEGGNQHFAAGKALFMANNFTEVLEYQTDMTNAVVHVPFPKYSAAQSRYYSLVHMCFEPIAISANVVDAERTALITEALCYYSEPLNGKVEDLLLGTAPTDDARALLQLTLDSKVYDFEYTANIMGWTSEANNLFCKGELSDYQATMTSLARQAVKGTGGGTLEKFLASYGKIRFG